MAELQATIGSDEVAEWIAYYQLFPERLSTADALAAVFRATGLENAGPLPDPMAARAAVEHLYKRSADDHDR